MIRPWISPQRSGLTLAQKMQRRWPGYSLAVVGFIIATLPMLSQLVLMWQR